MGTADKDSRARDIYASDLAEHQLAYDAKDYRRSLYTNLKADHPANWLSGEPCDCEAGGAGWERAGIAMTVLWPPGPQHEATHSPQRAELEAEAG